MHYCCKGQAQFTDGLGLYYDINHLFDLLQLEIVYIEIV